MSKDELVDYISNGWTYTDFDDMIDEWFGIVALEGDIRDALITELARGKERDLSVLRPVDWAGETIVTIGEPMGHYLTSLRIISLKTGITYGCK